MKIITLTFNPAYDIHCYTDKFLLHHENKIVSLTKDIGGKGINISRALIKSKIENKAFVILGRENCSEFENYLESENISYVPFYIDGRIRENITIHESGSPETRISFEGFKADENILKNISESLASSVDADTFITMTGSLPVGLEKEKVKELLLEQKHKGARIIIDSRSFTLDDILEIKPYLIKPNEEEILFYSNRRTDTLEDVVASGIELRLLGVENVIISLGERGAILSSNDGNYIANAPNIDVKSTIGAGDSSIAGALLSKSSKEMLRLAVAYGSAACMEEGTNPPKLENINKLLGTIIVKKLEY